MRDKDSIQLTEAYNKVYLKEADDSSKGASGSIPLGKNFAPTLAQVLKEVKALLFPGGKGHHVLVKKTTHQPSGGTGAYEDPATYEQVDGGEVEGFLYGVTIGNNSDIKVLIQKPNGEKIEEYINPDSTLKKIHEIEPHYVRNNK